MVNITTECTKEMKIFKKAVGFDNNFVISVSVIWGRKGIGSHFFLGTKESDERVNSGFKLFGKSDSEK